MSRYALDGRPKGRFFAPEVHDYAVSKARGDELRAEWSRVAQAWRDGQTDWLKLEEWVETFAPDHPEWLEVPAAVSSPSEVPAETK